MKFLIIGSKGFIGSHLLKKCREKHEAWGCDVVVDYEQKQYIQISIVNADFHDVFSKQQFDICINCSGAASVPASFENPLKDYELNTANTYRILDAIKNYNAQCKFINLSSAAVYGNTFQLPVKESTTAQPISPYGLHKKQAEEICLSMFKYWQIPTCSIRIFSAYGPGLTKQLFWDLYKKSLQGNKVELFGTGDETRDFIYIDDLVNAILLIAEKAKFEGEYINVANGKQWRIKEIVEIFFNKLEWRGEIKFINSGRTGDPLNWEADISILKQMSYLQQVTMEQGILNYVHWLKERK